ncbi:MAG: hypothetical protein ACPG7F_22170, partial [Aggregatilineales bacterium]
KCFSSERTAWINKFRALRLRDDVKDVSRMDMPARRCIFQSLIHFQQNLRTLHDMSTRFTLAWAGDCP